MALSLMLPSHATPQTIQTIADIGQPTMLYVAKGARLADDVFDRCGTLDPVYLAELLKSNGNLTFDDLQEMRAGTRVEFPACARAPIDDPVANVFRDALATKNKHSWADSNPGIEILNSGIAWPSKPTGTALATLGLGDGFTWQQNSTWQQNGEANYAHLFEPSVKKPSQDLPSYLTAYPLSTEEHDLESLKAASNVLAVLKNVTEQIEDKHIVGQNLSNLTEKYYSIVATFPVTSADAARVGALRKPSVLWSSITLRPGEDPSVAKAHLDAVLRPATDAADTAQSGPTSALSAASTTGDTTFAELVGSVDDNDPKVVGHCVGAETATERWPFDVLMMLRVLGLNSRIRRHNPLRPARVLVADTGFDQNIQNPDPFHDYIPWLKALQGRRGNVPQGSDDVVGNNVALWNNDPSTPAGLGASRFHSLEVGGAALGGQTLEDLRTLGSSRSDTQRLIQVAFVSLMDADAAIPKIKSTSIANTYEIASNNEISVINLSLTMTDMPIEFKSPMAEYHDKIMLVVAAGNEANPIDDLVDLDTHPRWPAMFGGDPANAPGGAVVVTVGAHDARDNISPFSVRSGRHVDLLAPGCKVPTYGADAEGATIKVHPVSVSGTSFAAPLVSFVAATLVREGLSVAQVKSRLIVSVDEKPDLAGKVYSSGILNAWRALAVHHDVVTYQDGEETKTVIGHVLPGRQTVELCGKPLRLRWLRKLVLTPTAGTVMVSSWHADGSPNALIRDASCPTQDGDELSSIIEVVDSKTEQKVSIPVRAIRDWTPPFYPGTPQN